MELFKLLGRVAIENGEANKALDETADKGEKAESKLSKAFSGIGKGAAVVGKAVVAGMAAAGAGITALVTTSVKGYAEYEQLVGGVETLFAGTKESYWDFVDALRAGGATIDEANKKWGEVQQGQYTVLENAAEAYKTAGMSANDYMETVTGFSAALIQSLGGDTAKAANYAHTAIVDMSDNANKMGSDLEALKTAYAGFSKQNYTMLDNLNVGGIAA